MADLCDISSLQDLSISGRGAIDIIGLSRIFAGSLRAVDGINLSIQPGEFFTLLGPSGCGKTTLLRMIAGFETPDEGRILISGREMQAVPTHLRPVNTVFQSYALFPHLDVEQNIAFGLRMRGIRPAARQARVREMIDIMQIGPLASRRISQLSGGQRQRVALARALVNEPEVMLLDEPLSALDAKLRAELQVELLRMQKKLGTTFIFVTHDQQEALVMSDRIAVMNHGRIQQIGPVLDVYESPRNVFVAEFLGLSNIWPVSPRADNLLDTPIGALALTRRAKAGDMAMIRPEKIILHNGTAYPPGRVNLFSGTIAEAIYMGATTQYRVDLGGQRFVTAQDSNNHAAERSWRTGETVTVELQPDNIMLIES